MEGRDVLIQLLAILLSVISLQAAAPSDDRKAILGVWSGGMPGDPPDSIELTITPTKITGRNARTGKDLGEGSYAIDSSAKTIDARGIGGPVKGKTYRGLYSLEGNTLRWVSQSGGKRRPGDLVHRPEKDQWLMVLQRQK